MGRTRERKKYRKSKEGEEDEDWISDGGKGMNIVVKSRVKKAGE